MGKDVKKQEPSHRAAENAKRCSCRGSLVLLQKVNTDSRDPATPLLGTDLKEHDRCLNACTRFIATLLMTAGRWKQPKCPSTEEQMNKLWSSHTMEHHSVIERTEH